MYALVSADFPGVSTSQREEIYECLKENGWIKIKNVGRDITTCWFAQFESYVTYRGILKAIENDFGTCSYKYCRPRLVIQIGDNKPVEINL
ncbi:MAG TPA: hypothetical protein PKC58_15610 [Ignavibacteria bacterium]|nr:hypothetical protein [Ignavibacteria bacterium]